MALDTNLTPEIVNSFNVYIDGVKAIGTAPEITLPQITSETIDVSGSGILGKISAPNIGQFESIEKVKEEQGVTLDKDLSVESLKKLVELFKAAIKEQT